MPYLVGIASNIVDRGDVASYPHLNQLCEGVIRTGELPAMCWVLLRGASACLDQGKFDAWRTRRAGMFFDEIDRLFGLMQGVAAGGPDAKVYADDINEVIERAGRTEEPWTTLSQLTVAALEVADRGQLEMWMYSPAP